MLGQGAAGHDGAGAAFFERRVVEEAEGVDVEDALGHGRGGDGVAGVEADVAGFDAVQDVLEAFGVDGLVEAVVHGLGDQRVVGHFERSGEVFLAADLGGEDGGEEVVGDHALEVGWDLFAAAAAGHGQGAGRGPAPAGVPEGGVEHGLAQGLFDVGGLEVFEGFVEGEGLRGSEGEDDGFFVGGGLQLEVEADAEALAQGEAPGAVDAGAERGVDDQLLAAGFVEEALEDDIGVGGHDAERVLGRAEVFEQLLGGGGAHSAAALELGVRRFQVVELGGDVAAQLADGGGEFDAAAGRFAEPEGDGGRRAVGVFDADDAFAFDAANAPGGGAEQEDVAGLALDGEVFVDGADERAFGFFDDAEVAGFGDHAAVEQGGEAGGSARAQHAVDAVAMN